MVIELPPAGRRQGSGAPGAGRAGPRPRCCSAGTTWATGRLFAAAAQLRAEGIPGVVVCSGSAEVTDLADEADLTVDGPPGVEAALAGYELAGGLRASPGRLAGRRTSGRGDPAAPRGRQPGRPAEIPLGVAHRQRLVQRRGRRRDIERVDSAAPPSPSSAAAPASRGTGPARQPRSETIRLALACQVFMPCPDRVDEQHVGDPVALLQGPGVVVIGLHDQRRPVVGRELGLDLRRQLLHLPPRTRGTRAGPCARGRRRPGA